ncbi:MAG: hypothetical protein AAF485_07150 [Chloroflexota bacterium]
MLRIILSVLAGFFLWTILWLTSNAALAALMPNSFREDGSTSNVGLLITILILSIIFSIVAGYVAAKIAQTGKWTAAWALGILQLVVGVFVQLQFWNVLPLWYHLIFLALLLPGILLGAKLKSS